MAIYFVTGASRGIGLELVDQLSRISTNTVIAAVRTISSSLGGLEKERGNLHTVICDVSSEESIQSLKVSLPRILTAEAKITHLINNAASLAGPDTRGLSVTSESLNFNIAVNVLGPAFVLPTVLPFLAPNATVVNLSSGIGSLQLVADGTIPARITSYSISKCALNMLTVHQAQELKGKARVACLDPGHVKTDMGGEAAVVEIADSANGIRTVLEKLEEDVHGDREVGRARFLNYLGEEVPW